MARERYVVYFPKNILSDCRQFHVSRDAKVIDLMSDMKNYWSAGIQSTSELCLFNVKAGNLPQGAPHERYENAGKWLRGHAATSRMDSGKRMSDFFPEGPAPEGHKCIDVVATTDAMLNDVIHRATPDDEPPLENQSAPRIPESEIAEKVKDALVGYDEKLKKYLSGPAWSDFWEDPSPINDETARFINDLKIPVKSGNPVLLLHALGEDVVDQKLVDEVFNLTSSFLVNTTGSGKTRLLLEGLIKHWGFYFTSVVHGMNHNFGSKDMAKSIFTHIPTASGFVEHPSLLSDVKARRRAFVRNHSIAERRTSQVLMARIFVFRRFLEVAQEIFPNRSLNEFRKHWLFLQLWPNNILGRDVFVDISEILRYATDESLNKGGFRSTLRNLQDRFSLGENFFLILDEAQVAIDSLTRSFCSEQNPEVYRPVLRPIISSWQDDAGCPIIVSGTSLSIDVVNEVNTASAMKVKPFTLQTLTGAFDEKSRQSEYIRRYMPPGMAETDSGKAFLERAWNYVRGRHRFTAALLTLLLKFSFRSPHRILNSYIEVTCGFVPSDARRLVDKEQEISNLKARIDKIAFFDFSKLFADPPRLVDFSSVLYAWLLLRKPVPLTHKNKDLIELGLARFVSLQNSDAHVDEHMVLLAAAHEFGSRGFSLGSHVKRDLTMEAGRGQYFEALVAYHLSCAFGIDSKLCDIFDFGENVPEWAKQHAHLVSIALDDGEVEANRFHFQDSLGSTSPIAVQCNTLQEMEKWLENPSSLMCFPNATVGPDIVLFIRLACGLVLAVLVQCKWLSAGTLDKLVLDDARSSLKFSQLFGRQREHQKRARESALRLLEPLNEEQSDILLDKWFQDGQPALAVIASYPAIAPEASEAPFYVRLDMDRGASQVDSECLLELMSTSIKRPVQNDGSAAPRKRRRTYTSKKTGEKTGKRQGQKKPPSRSSGSK